jgi:tRNA dimethylallyltransferase
MPSAGDGLPPRVLVVVGPTGIGKTAMGVRLAEQFNGEIVGADSRQIYQKMDMGTAKPTAEERARAVHHLIDIVDPGYNFTLTEYQDRAYAVIGDILARGNLPIIVGGTGQYVTATLEGWQVPDVPPDLRLRDELEAYAAAQGSDALFARLAAIDPGAVGLVDPRNVRRVIRAYEVSVVSGTPFSQQRRRAAPGWDTLEIALTMDRAALDVRTDARIDAMMARGLLDEVRGLHAMGYDWRLPAMSGLGYAQLGDYLRGECTLAEAVYQIKADTRLFVRRQYTWFRKHGAVRWIDVEHTAWEAIEALVRAWLAGTLTSLPSRAQRLAEALAERDQAVGPRLIGPTDPPDAARPDQPPSAARDGGPNVPRT